MKHQIKRIDGSVLFECDMPDGVISGLEMRHAIEKAARDGANLRGAYLRGANLDGANLDGANLDGAYLRGAYLDGMMLGDKKLIGGRPVFQIGPIGSRSDYLVTLFTDAGIVLRAGCFTGTAAEFREKLEAEHGDNNHAKEYLAALELIAVHAELWGVL